MYVVIKIFPILLFLIFLTSQLHSQTVDSLEKLIDASENDSVKVSLLFETGKIYEINNPDSALLYYNQALDISKNINNKNLEANALLRIAVTNHYFNAPNEIVNLYLNAYNLFKEIEDSTNIAYVSKVVSGVYINLNKIDSALFFIYNSLEIYKKLDDYEGIIGCYLIIGSIHKETQNYEDAINDYQEVLRYALEINNNIYLFYSYNYLGVVYLELKNYDNAISNLLKAELIAENEAHKAFMAVVYENLARFYFETNEIKKSKTYITKSKEIIESKKDYTALMRLYNLEMKVELKNNNYISAENIANKTFEILNIHRGQITLEILADFYKSYSDLLSLQENYKKSYEYFSKYNTLKDTIAKLTISKISLELYFRYNFEQTKSQIDKLTKINELNQQIIDKTEHQKKVQTRVIVILIVLFITIIILVFYINKSNINNKRLNRELLQKNEEIIQTQNKISRIVDALPQIFFEANSKGEILITNEFFYEMSGYSKADFKSGMRYIDFLPDIEKGKIKNDLKHLLNGSRIKTIDFLFLKKDGTTFPALMSISRKEVNKKVEFYGVIIDVSDKKQVEEDLLLLKTSVEHSGNAIIITDKELKIKYANPAFSTITGYYKDEIMGKKPSFFKSGKTSKEIYNDLWNTILDGKVWKGKLLNRKKDGSLFWERNAIKAVYNSSGKIINYIAIKEDITEEVEKNEQILKLFSATQNSPISVMILNENAEITYINPSFTKMTGYTEAEVLGKNPSFLDSDEHEKEFYDQLWDSIYKGELWQGILINKRKNGELYWDASIMIPLKNEDGKVLGYVCNDRDITLEIKMNEEFHNTLEELNEKNKEIMSSIDYAKRIQKALIPSKDEFYRLFPKSFIFFMPKDVVSGDFYWVHETANMKFLAMVDCTGHSVPGAFLSIIGLNILDSAVVERKLFLPSEILNYMSFKIKQIFEKTDEKDTVKDDMEISLISFDIENNKFNFSSSRNRMYISRQNKQFLKPNTLKVDVLYKNERKKMYRIQGEREFIGKISKKANFHDYSANYFKDDVFYIFSDGYYDQFGGPDNKKYKRKYLEKKIFDISHINLISQRQILTDFFFAWKNNLPQTDDVTVIGVIPDNL